MSVRVRFAPSPTGDPHIGSIWTALMNWLFARKNNGVFVLRIEDTDQERLVQGSTEKILEALEWYGLKPDEGPFYQSQRLDLYKKYAEELVEKGSAYYCFCSADRLKKLREEAEVAKRASKYDRYCLQLTPDEIEQKKGSGPAHRSLGVGGEKFVIRLKMPTGKTKFTDLIRGIVEFDNDLLDDQVLIKSDGYPTYHLANVVDDHDMKITHVIRAEEWLPSTPKHLILYEMFGWTPPAFAHLPLILGPDRSKLSKRHGAVSALSFRDEGYLPDAMVNFLALLGWNPGTEQEIFSREELLKVFSLEHMNKSGAIFNREKLDWMNGMYVRKLSLEEFTTRAKPFLPLLEGESASWRRGEDFLQHALATVQERTKRLNELPQLTHFYFKRPTVDPKLLIWKKETKESVKSHLTQLISFYESASFTWNIQTLEQETKALIEKNTLGVGETLWPMRVALSGEKASPGPFEIAAVLGKEGTLERLRVAITIL